MIAPLFYETFQPGAVGLLHWGIQQPGQDYGGIAAVGTGSSQTFTATGRITAGQSVPAGTYADTMTVTVTF
jgi:spore coat protein U-like protein